MKKYIIVLIIFLDLFPTLAGAQAVGGVVVDAAGAPLPFVNVVELSQADSSFVGGTVSRDDGTFALDHVKTGNILRFYYTGYTT